MRVLTSRRTTRCVSLYLHTVLKIFISFRRYIERSEIEALYFHINTLLKSLNQGVFIPQDGQLIHDVERNWEALDRAEHKREVALREELLRQERLEQLNYKFEKKVCRRSIVATRVQIGHVRIYREFFVFVDFLERSPRRLPERNDPSAQRPEVRQQFDTSGRNGQETRGHQRRHHGPGGTVSRFERDERGVGERKLSRCAESEKERRGSVAAVERPFETVGEPQNKPEQHKHDVFHAQGNRNGHVYHTGNVSIGYN